MKLSFLCWFLSVILITPMGCSQETEKDPVSGKEDDRITIGTRHSIYSEVLGEQRRIHVFLPAGVGNADTSKHYPVLYLLDGDYHFHSVTGLLHQLADNGMCPEMIVVAIPNTDRSRDLTPTRSMELPNGKTAPFLKTTGGAENFTRFLETELIPYVEKRYPTAPHRLLVGHSFGGLFVINTLVNHPQLFDSYVAIDPSLWWDREKLLLRSDTVLRENKFHGKTLFVSLANTMHPGMDTVGVGADTTKVTSHIRSIIRLARSAEINRAKNGLNFSWKYYPDDTHNSVPLISEYDALRFMFSYYRLPLHPGITAGDYKEHFKSVSARIGYRMLPPESSVNETGYYFLRDKKFEQSFGFFQLNIRNYPKSANAFDSMGDYYVAVGDKLKAIEYFEKALALGGSAKTRKKLRDIRK